MPFKSEKQRRFLWAKHPEIAKEWAHKYPDSNKGLPMYAHDKQEEDKPVSKAAALNALKTLVVNNLNTPVKSVFTSACDKNTKKADSKLEQIKLPQDTKPTYAGERKLESILKPETEDEGNIGETRNVNHAENDVNTAENPLLSKLAVVLAPKIQQEIENRRAQEEAREANRMPQNVNIKKYPVQNFNVPPPMGMTAPQAPQAPQQQPQQAQQAPQNGQMAPVGGGNSPNANPINSFGGLSSTGDINGNAALGTQNMAGGEKMAARKCSCGCGQKVSDCKCPPSCSCRQKGGSCYGLKKQAGGNNPALAKIMSIAGDPLIDPSELDELESEMFDKAADSPAWQRSEGKNEAGGLNEKGRKSYEREHGGNLKAPVTESNPSGERAKRQNSFCSRMCGMKRVNTGAKTKSDPDSRINKSLRKWNCKCSSAFEFGQQLSDKLQTKESSSKAQFFLNGFGGGRYQFGEGSIAPEVGYKHLFGVVPFPFVGVRIGNKKHGLNIRGPWPSINYSDATEPHDTIWNSHRSHASGWMGEKGRSLWGLMADGFKSPNVALMDAAADLRDSGKTDVKDFEGLLRYYGYGQDSQRVRQFAELLANKAQSKVPGKLDDAADDIAHTVELPSVKAKSDRNGKTQEMIHELAGEIAG